MRHIHDILRERLYRATGLIEGPIIPYEQMKQTEWCLEFEELMRNRLIVGGYRYGPIGSNDKPQYDRIGSAQRRLDKYLETGNTECLVDVANMAMVEFVKGNHPNKHFYAEDEPEVRDRPIGT